MIRFIFLFLFIGVFVTPVSAAVGGADTVGSFLGLEPAEVFGVLAVVSLVCRLIGKAIPDDAGGLLGFIRTGCKVLGLYVSNRVTSGISTTDAARGALTIANVAKVAREKT